MKDTEPEGPYIIVGYSSGAFVAIELALELQDTGENEVLHLLDMTPGRYHALVQENFGSDISKVDDEEFMITALTQTLGFDREEASYNNIINIIKITHNLNLSKISIDFITLHYFMYSLKK